MASLFRYNFRRIFISKYVYILFGVGIAFIAISLLTLKLSAQLVPEGSARDAALEGLKGLSALKSGANNSMFTILGAILVSIFATEEFTQDTIKNVYGKGFDRKSIFVSYYVVSLIISLSFVIIASLFSFLFAILLQGGMGEAGENYILSLVGLLFVVIAFHAVFFSIAISIRKSGGAVALTIVGPTLVTGLLLLADTLMFKTGDFKLSNFWISNRMSMMEAQNVPMDDIIGTFVSSLVVTAIFLPLGFIINLKRDR